MQEVLIEFILYPLIDTRWGTEFFGHRDFITSEITIKAGTVSQEASGGKKTELSAAAFKVNNGNLEVL